ncbi:MAG: DMT family transporter [Rhodobiaceae bacterium]|nr:DMT family transporter [Rhodobiaceae bacterium]MCC0015244.1 DMT family transporter [Rhodobiaceae bacterium]MCC0042668.1 DMT family transporter [Rhodobiaceae bacterium]MCC0053516.1 DMT family transporter [Rhodobiaceae bacterium]
MQSVPEESLSDAAEAATDRSYAAGIVMCLVAGVCWSFMGLFVRLIETADAWQILFYRSLALVGFLAAVLLVRAPRRFASVIRDAGKAGVIGGLSLVAAFSGGVYSLQATSIANAVFLFAASPLIAALLGRLLLGESVRRATWAAMALALVGIAIMVMEGISLGRGDGNFAALMAATGFAGFAVALRHGRLSDMLPAVFLGGVFATIFAFLVCMATGKGIVLPLRDTTISLSLGVFALGLGLILFTAGSKAIPAAEIALLSMTEVILAPVWVWLFLGETANANVLLGGLVLLLALVGNALSGVRRKPVPLIP